MRQPAVFDVAGMSLLEDRHFTNSAEKGGLVNDNRKYDCYAQKFTEVRILFPALDLQVVWENSETF